MAKRKAGLPGDYDLDVDTQEEPAAKPMNIGGYLDDLHPAVNQKAPAARMEQSVVPETRPRDTPSPRRKEGEGRAPVPTTQRPRNLTSPQAPTRALHKQVNMKAETWDCLDELTQHISAYSDLRNPYTSEIFEALVLAVYEARELLVLDDVPVRGRWGTPTAAIVPIALKNAFQRAIAEHLRNS